MAEADDKLDFCKQALGELGTRSTITALEPPDGSPEAFYCNLFFASTRDQLLRAAHWGCAGRSDIANLWKALPGTPENPTIPTDWRWNSARDPALPWLYSYEYPSGGVVQIRRVRGQSPTGNDDLSSVPLYGGAFSLPNYNSFSAVPFEVATDRFDQSGSMLSFTQAVGTVAIVTPGTGHQPGDNLTLGGGGGVAGNPAILQVVQVDAAGGVVNFLVQGSGGSYSTAATSTMTQAATTGIGIGFTCDGVFIDHDPVVKIILTNASNAIFDSTTSDILIAQYDAGFSDAFGLALQGKLALALIGDKQLAAAKLQQANAAIIEARVRDGNEGLTVYDHVPDWLQVRGVASMTPTLPFNPPYGPLFGV